MAKEQDVIQLPFKITEFNADMIIALDRNFKEIERQLSSLQLNIKAITGGSVSSIVGKGNEWSQAALDAETAVKAGMGVDADCTGLWHFDNSLNNHKGIAAIASIPAVFETGKFGKSLMLDDTQIIKVATSDTLVPEEGTVTLYASNLATADNGSIILDIPNSDGGQGLWCGISADAGHEGEVFISDADRAFNYTETTQADFQTGTLVDVTATSAGDLELSSQYVDISSTSGAISGGDYSTYTKDKAFDNNATSLANSWYSSQGASAVSGAAYIGQDFGSPKIIKRVRIRQNGLDNYAITSAKLQTSSNGADWADAQTMPLNIDGNWQTIDIVNPVSARYWRLLANANTSSGWWVVYEIEFMEVQYYSPGSREKVVDLSQVTAVLDSSLSFDKTDAIQAGNFARASVAYKEDGTQVAAGVPRYEAGKFGNGVHMEEATVNLVSNPSFESGDFTGWFSIFQSGLNYWKISTAKFQGQYSAVLEGTGAGTHAWRSIGAKVSNPVVGAVYSFSAYFKCDIGITYGVQILVTTSTDGGATWTRGKAGLPVITSTNWEKAEVQYTIESGVNAIAIEICSSTGNASGKKVYVDAVKIEQKPYATSFLDGTRAADNLCYTLPNGLPSEWFCSGVWVPDQDSTINKTDVMILTCLHADSDNGCFFQYNPIGDTLSFSKKSAGVWNNLYSSAVSFSAGQVIEWACAHLDNAYEDLGAGNHLWYRINGGSIGHVTKADTPIAVAPTKTYIGCHTVAGYETNGVIDTIKLVDIATAAASGTTISEAWAESFLTATTAPTADEATILLANFDNTLNATTGTVKVEAALSTDGGATYGAYQKCTSGQAIPGITAGMATANAKLKLKESLNTYGGASPQLHSLNLSITEKDATTVYGPHKSGLTSWDMISLAWKTERLSLVVNGMEGCFIENPGLPVALGAHAYIGCGRNSDKRIAVPIDELRIDAKYKDANIRRAWYSLQSPFYTSDDLAQLPGYIKPETDGWKVYDAEGNLRGTYGSWIDGDGVRQYGLRLVNGVVETNVLIVNKTAGGIIDMINGYGDGSDGDLAAGTTISVPAHDQQVVIKQYNSINIPAGQTLTVDKRICGLFLLCRGDVTINGTIDLDGKGGKYYSGAAPAVSGTILSAIPSGGNGGNGGNGGKGAYGSGDYTFYQGNPGSGSGGSSGKWYAGGWGGAGGGGAGSSCVFAKWGGGTPGSGGNAGQSIELNPLGTGGSGGSPEGGNGGVGGNFCGGGGGAGNEGHGGGGGAGYVGGNPGQYSYNDPGAHVAAAGTSGMGIGGGTLVIVAKGTITIGSTGQIKCNGLNGGNGGSGACQSYTGADWTGSGGGGGQGGGGGGSVLLAYGTALVNNGTITVNGGAAGYGGQGGLCSADQSELGYEGYNGSPGTSGTVGGIATKKLT